MVSSRQLHGAARDASLSRQIAPGGQPRARGERSCLEGLSDRPVDLCSQRCPSGTIEVEKEGSHRSMVCSELPISVLFYGRGGRT